MLREATVAFCLVGMAATMSAASAATGEPFDSDAAWSFQVDQADAWLGTRVASAGDVDGDGMDDILAAAPQWENGEIHEGAIFLVRGTAVEGGLEPDWVLEGNRPDAFLARAAAAGDLNGDGFGDVVVGDPYYSAGLANRGRAMVFLGSPAGLSTNPAWTVDGDRSGLLLGAAISSAGDVNHDGYGDLVVSGSGLVLLFLGSAEGPEPAPAWSVEGFLPADYGLGPVAFDANGDGFDDLLVVALDESTGQSILMLYRGYPRGLRPRAHAVFEDVVADSRFGINSSPAGDVDQDGNAELLLGTIGLLDIPPGGGSFLPEQVLLFEGGGKGLRLPGDLIHTTNSHKDLVPLGLGPAGDVNGDGFDDVIISEYFVDPNAGVFPPIRVQVYAGSSEGAIGSPAATVLGTQHLDGFGEAAAAAGDFDGDGCDDLLVGAPRHDDGENDEGVVFIFRGGSFQSN